MATTKPALTAARAIKQELELRLGGLWVATESLDASGNPVLKVSLVADVPQWTAADEYAYLRVKPVATSNVDVLGLGQTVFCPHVIQVAFEESAVADVSVLTAPTLIKILGTLLARGMSVEVYHSANTVEPVVGTLVAANLQHAWKPDVYGGITNQI